MVILGINMKTTYTVHRVHNGEDKVIGHFNVQDEELSFSSSTDEANCSMFPSGKLSEITKARLSTLLDNEAKSVYITRAS